MLLDPGWIRVSILSRLEGGRGISHVSVLTVSSPCLKRMGPSRRRMLCVTLWLLRNVIADGIADVPAAVTQFERTLSCDSDVA